MSWQRCLDEYKVRKVTIDKQRSISLRKIADKRKKFIDTIPNIESNLIFIFESYYTLLIEILHALAYEKGFDIENHICLGYFLREFYNLDKAQRLFDKFRKNRNSIVYYGEELTNDVLEKNINEIKFMVDLINGL